jgi:hypothetical protein
MKVLIIILKKPLVGLIVVNVRFYKTFSAMHLMVCVYYYLFITGFLFVGSGSDTFFEAGSCIDGRLTSAWNWCSKIEKKRYYHVFLLCGFTGFKLCFYLSLLL